MPLYEYCCKECGHKFEKIQSFSAPDEKECPVCKGELERLISAPAIQFKGAGWYVNDYAGKGSKAKSANASGESSGNASGGDGKSSSSESKPASSGDGSAAKASAAAKSE